MTPADWMALTAAGLAIAGAIVAVMTLRLDIREKRARATEDAVAQVWDSKAWVPHPFAAGGLAGQDVMYMTGPAGPQLVRVLEEDGHELLVSNLQYASEPFKVDARWDIMVKVSPNNEGGTDE